MSKHRIWGDAAEVTQRLNDGETNLQDEATEYGCSINTVSLVRKHHMGDDYLPLGQTVPKADWPLVSELLSDGMTCTEVAVKWEVQTRSMKRFVNNMRNLEADARKQRVPGPTVTISGLSNGYCELGDGLHILKRRGLEPRVIIEQDEYIRLKKAAGEEL